MIKQIFSAFLVGAATGAAMGVLFSPDKGSKTRKKLSESTRDIIDELSRKIDESKETLTDLKERVTSVAGKAYKMSDGQHERVERAAGARVGRS